jgi:hypothetical protein|tara:strand:+ start:575 stop:763 length:189 start_codon:yes stop_codon:yes gene_type:complete
LGVFSILSKLAQINANGVLKIWLFLSTMFQGKTRDKFRAAVLPGVSYMVARFVVFEAIWPYF